MKDNWHDQEFARRWDATSNFGNPARKDLIELLARIVGATLQEGTKLLDLGFGSGQLEDLLFQRVAGLEFIGVDSSDEMIALANKRLNQHRGKFTVIKHELNEISTLKSVDGAVSVAVSVQALHELTHVDKQEVFKFIHNTLLKGGYYLIADRFTLPKALEQAYAPAWTYAEERTSQPTRLPFAEYSAKMQSKEDFTAPMPQHIQWLEEAGFTASCVYFSIDRGLIVARKP